ncbi:MAG TPA: formate dehydrogenase accessory sulfurtransferase FdhD [Verrucomicrobiae bacterium]|nr:formate dehydrogenase accessory sulfurtransferase FdhD [Verrucomicrobiae bacterium]
MSNGANTLRSRRRKEPDSPATASSRPLLQSTTAATSVLKLSAGNTTEQTDLLAVEEPLEIRVRGRSIAVTMRTPGDDRELVAGFLFSEGVIRERRHLADIAPCRASPQPGNSLDVFLRSGMEVDFAQLTRHVFATSSCGLCGKASIDAVKQRFPPITSSLSVSARTLLHLPDRMRRAQKAFAQTGGLHAAAIFDAKGKLIVLREDIGRHNAVDKVVGWGFLENKLQFDSHLLLVSGRASFEILQKALAARIPIVCAVSAPSSLAVRFAHESSQTLVGFLRGESMNVYTHRERVVGQASRLSPK